MDVIGTDFENWGPYLMKQFQLMYEKGERCDLEISCNKQIFLVHRLIMSACSEYVRELGDKQHIILPDEVSCKALKTVIDFVYSGKIVFNKDDKEDLLLASNLLNMRLLTELIKMEESCSFTLSMDDEVEENKNLESASNCLSTDNTENNSLNINDQLSLQVPNQSTKRKSGEMKTNRSRSNKNANLLPPLFKLPYLQQKFSASRTYGLITTLTDPVPSRFEIPENILQSCGYRSTFEDVTYETEILCSDENFVTLESAHQEFLKKMRESVSYKRSYSNSLYSPFDKYTPPYNINSDLIGSRKREPVREPVQSYLSSTESVPAKTARRNQQNKTSTAPKKSVSFAKEPQIITEKINTPQQTSKIQTNEIQTSEIHTNEMQTNEIQSATYVMNGMELELPDPLTPVANVSQEIPPEIVEVPSAENGEKVELLKLNNAVVTDINEYKSCSAQEELPDISISVIAPENQSLSDEVKEEIPQKEENPPSVTNFSNLSQETETEASSLANSTVVPEIILPVPEKPVNVTETVPMITSQDESVLPESMEVDNQTSSNLIMDANNSTVNETPNPIKSILSDSAVFTQIDNTNITDVSSNTNSQIFALKVKGTENPAQLSKLVDLCKKNPLFKNKNVKFKIVPVKGPIPNSLKDQTRLGGNVFNKAIIVKKKIEDPKNENQKNISEIATNKKEKIPSIDNVTGPWDCKACGEPEKPLKLNTYFDFRSHLHDVHKEANNPVYCMYCGHKALKRNMQLYHLFIKHSIKPPSHLNFPKCDKCQFYALNDYYLQKHLSSHESSKMEYVCSCKVAFKSSDLLQKHMVSNDCKNLKSFTCGYCRSIFDRFVNLKAHMRVCMKERSKPILQNNSEVNAEPSPKTISDGGKDYVSL